MPVVLALYALVPPRGRNALLAAVSIVFFASILLNYLAGRAIGRAKDSGRPAVARRVMWAAIVANLLVLFTWKYAVFAAHQLNDLLGVLGADHVGVPSILLPIGISFFTFHAISYVVDITRGQATPMRRIDDYAQYMAFFPQLIAGPIIRYHQIADQIRRPPPRSQRLDDLAEGFPRFALGLSKKVLIADQVGPVADAAFRHASGLNSTAAWVGALAYTVQIYFDFSGYSDMAIGMGRMFGFWFRDYVYIPLGGSRGSQARTCFNLMFVFLLTGTWHGAAWTFVLWGIYNGALLVGERLTGIRTLPDARLATARRAGTFLVVVLGWVLFRAASVGDAGDVYASMFSF